MSSLLHSLISIAMGLLVLAAPALCVCTEDVAPRQEVAHQCCSSKDADHGEKDHSGACTHCGAQTVRLTMDQSPSLALMFPVALIPSDISIDLLLQTVSTTACMGISQDPPGNPTPVQSHTCSLT